MTQPDPIVLDLDPAGYVQGLGRAESSNDQFAASVRTVAVALGPLQRAMSTMTPSKAALGGVVAFTALAAKQQQVLSGVAATSKITGQNYERMAGGIRQMARDLPIGNKGAVEMAGTLQRLGVVSKSGYKELNAVSKGIADVNKSAVGGLPGVKKFSGALDEAFGTKGKLRGDTSKQIRELGTAFHRLGAATGESATGVAAGMVQLNRTMGTGLNVQRVEALSDSLTTLSANSGASGTGILQFSKSIGPMAAAAGIGQTQVMGIATAFTKLGDDGFAGANAFSKMMTDLNRSVREGTPHMAAYAQMAGKTTDEFRALYESNPAEALTQVVEAIGKSGNAPRMLEQIGLEGVRTARVLTNLAQAGDLRGEIATSVGAYGNGSTREAAGTAFGGLNDSLSMLATNAEQTAEALGRPFLGALTRVTDVMGGMLTPLREAIDNGPVQKTLSALSNAILPVLIGMKLLGPLLTGLGIFQMASSGPVRGFLGGYGASGGLGAGLARRLGGQGYIDRVANNQAVGVGRMAGINAASAVRGAQLGRLTTGSTVGTGPGMLNTLRMTGAAGLGMYMRTLGESARLARMPAWERGSASFRPMGGQWDRYMDTRAASGRLLSAGVIDRDEHRQAMRTAFQTLSKEAGGTAQALGTLRRGFMSMAGQGIASGGVLAARGLMRGGSALAGAFGGPVGLALTGAMVGGMVKSKVDSARETEAETQANATSWIDDYKMAIGEATSATSTFAGSLKEAAKAAGNAPMTEGQARGFDDSERDRAIAAGGKPIRSYKGMSVDAAANQISLQAGVAGMTPGTINRMQQDLALSGFSTDQVNQIMGRLPDDLSKPRESGDTEDVAAVVRDLAAAKRDNGKFRWRVRGDVLGAIMPDETQAAGTSISTLSKETKQGAGDLATNIRDRRQSRSRQYTAEFADSEMLKEMDRAVMAAYKSGNIDLQKKLTENFQRELGVETFGISGRDLEKSGGFSNVVARERKGFREGTFDPVMEARERGGGDVRADATASWTSTQIARQSGGKNELSSWFAAPVDGTPMNTIQSAIDRLVGPTGTPEDPRQQASTMQAVMQHARDTGMSMADLATKAGEAANAIGNVADASHQFLMAIHNEAVAVQESELTFGTAGAAAGQRGARFAEQARMDPNDEAVADMRTEGITGLRQMEKDAVQVAQERLSRQREYQKQSERMGEDYARQQLFAKEDYERSIARAEKDFGISRWRARRDFNRQMLHAEEDFGKQMKRQAEDAARGMYDAYSRIQVQPTWDAANLLGNLEEQNAAIDAQLENLGRIRNMGGSSSMIKLLGLNDPKNAQQLASLVGDAVSDPRVIATLNASADKRMSLGGELAQDEDNIGVERAVEDFRIQMDRAKGNFTIAMKDMADSQALNLKRAGEDRDRAMDRAALAYGTAVSRMQEDMARADEVIISDMAKLTEAMNKAVSGQFVDFQDLTKTGMQDWIGTMRSLQGDWKDIILGLDAEVKVTQSGSYQGSAVPYSVLERKGAAHFGGIATRRTNVLVSEQGVNEALIPLNNQGISALSEAMKRFITDDDVQSMRSSKGQSHATYVGPQITNIDQSQTIEQVTVVSNDPDQMISRLRAQQTRSNLTKPAQVR